MRISAISILSHILFTSGISSVVSLENVGNMFDLHPEYVGQQGDKNSAMFSDTDSPSTNEEGDFFVFLQKFPLEPIDIFFHTEVLVCDKKKFSDEQIQILENSIAEMTDFALVDKSLWSDWTMPCVELGYGGSPCDETCCSVPHREDQRNYPLNARRAVIGNADTDKKELYIYGTSKGKSGNQAFLDACGHHKCWSEWKGTDYNPITNNCNTFTSTILSCVYGLSEKKPDLSVSDMIKVTCNNKCHGATFQLDKAAGETALL